MDVGESVRQHMYACFRECRTTRSKSISLNGGTAICVCVMGCWAHLCRNAGTDCRVFLQLTGDACAGPPAELLDAASTTQQQQQQAVHGTFQRSCVDTFDLQLPPLGVLRTAAVWLEGRASPWHLDWIVVTGPGGTASGPPMHTERLGLQQSSMTQPLCPSCDASLYLKPHPTLHVGSVQVNRPSLCVAAGWAAAHAAPQAQHQLSQHCLLPSALRLHSAPLSCLQAVQTPGRQ